MILLAVLLYLQFGTSKVPLKKTPSDIGIKVPLETNPSDIGIRVPLQTNPSDIRIEMDERDFGNKTGL